MDKYKILESIGEGAYGIVVKAKNNITQQIVALKKVQLKNVEDVGISNNVIREIKALQYISDHTHIVSLYEVVPYGLGVVLVFEYMSSDLSEVIRDYNFQLSNAQIKAYLLMLLKGVTHLHKNRIMHRDLKPANLLLNSNGVLKIADFGLARIFSRDDKRLYSHQVATRWYRAPELLYGAKNYDEGVDLWAVGCIFGELLNNSPLFPGENDIDQLYCVFKSLGTPTEDQWPEMLDFPDYKKIIFCPMEPVLFEDLVPEADEITIKLLQKFLNFRSKGRVTADDALLDDYFFTKPMPSSYDDLPVPIRTRKIHPQMPFDFKLSLPIENYMIDPEFLNVDHFC